jgi:hypothetical protein
MARRILIAALAGAMLAAFPAHAQEDDPLLDGAPPPLQLPRPAPPKPSPPKPAPKPAAPADASLKAEQQRLARQADAQKAEQTRLSALAADLDARTARLDARERKLAEEEARIARQLAELDRKRSTPPPVIASLPPAPVEPPARLRIGYEDARTACTRAGMSEAVDQDFYSARYVAAPRWFERQREMRGRMRLDDREGYLTVDTVCQLDASGAVDRFDILD